MISAGRLGLGTVQFGVAYGVSNREGKVPGDAAAAILGHAASAGIAVLDTAPGYGDAEVVLGKAMPRPPVAQVVTKTPVIASPVIGPEWRDLVVASARQSLSRLGIARVHGLLVHHADELVRPGGHHLLAGLRDAKELSLTEKIGVSVYDAAEIDAVLSVFTPDIVQLPLNVLDQRLVRSGHLGRLKSLGAEIHVRSVFLQGLLLMEPADVHDYFAPIRPHLENIRAGFSVQGLSPMQGCLAAVLGRKECDVAIVGVTSLSDLRGILGALDGQTVAATALPDPGEIEARFLNPALWPAINA